MTDIHQNEEEIISHCTCRVGSHPNGLHECHYDSKRLNIYWWCELHWDKNTCPLIQGAPMTPQPQQHCEHEDYCWKYVTRRMNDIPEGWGCPYPCEHDTRSRPAPVPETLYTAGMVENRVKHAAAQAREDAMNKILLPILEEIRKGCILSTQSGDEYYNVSKEWVDDKIQSLMEAHRQRESVPACNVGKYAMYPPTIPPRETGRKSP